MNFSSILDISSFFIGMIINLILVSLMCYYFKRKYEILENAQTEQAKILYELLRRDSNKKSDSFLQTLHEQPDRVDYTQDPLLKQHVIESDSDSDSDSDSESDSEYEIEMTLPPNPPVSPSKIDLEEWVPETKVLVEPLVEILTEPLVESLPEPLVESLPEPLVETSKKEIKEILIDLETVDTESNYSKMSIKQLKDILSSKGIKHKNNMKKDELVDLVKDAEAEVTI